MTTRPSDPDYWYDPDTTGALLRQIREAGEYRRSDPPSAEPVAVRYTEMTPGGQRVKWEDIERLEAEVARLTNVIADEAEYNRPQIAAMRIADGWRAGAEAMRGACAVIAIEYPWSGIGQTIGKGIATAIRALPIPSPPAKETKT